MLKKLLMAAMGLGALSAIVGGGTFAAWSASATGTGTIGAATIGIRVNGALSGVTLTFAPQNLLPGESSSAAVDVTNDGSRATSSIVYSVDSQASSDEVACPNGWLSVTVPGAGGALAAGATYTAGNVTGTLHPAAPDSCAGKTFTVTVKAVATY